jgi:hypothetical protein
MRHDNRRVDRNRALREAAFAWSFCRMSGRIVNRTGGKSMPKAKKSYTLSPESVEFLEAIRRKRHAASTSAVLEEILKSVREDHERASLARAVADYYTTLTDKEVTEQAAWGELAELEFSNRERP